MASGDDLSHAMYKELSATISPDYWELQPKPADGGKPRKFTPIALKPIGLRHGAAQPPCWQNPFTARQRLRQRWGWLMKYGALPPTRPSSRRLTCWSSYPAAMPTGRPVGPETEWARTNLRSNRLFAPLSRRDRAQECDRFGREEGRAGGPGLLGAAHARLSAFSRKPGAFPGPSSSKQVRTSMLGSSVPYSQRSGACTPFK
jgi:hypothetical protein